MTADAVNKSVLAFVNEKTENLVKDFKGIKTICQDESDHFLCFAIKKEFKIQFQNHLRKVLCDAICEKMKYNFLIKNINKRTKDETLFQTFVKVYTYFDIELEKEVVLRNIYFPRELNLNSFLFFRLHALKQKWQEMCVLANQNSAVFLKNESFLDLLKFLIDNLDYKCEKIIVDEEQNKLFAKKGEMQEFLCEYSNQLDILTKIIELSPKNIIILGSTNRENQILFKDLLGNRVVFEEK